MFFGLNISFWMVSINNFKLLLLLCYDFYRCLLSLLSGGDLQGGNAFADVGTKLSRLNSSYCCCYCRTGWSLTSAKCLILLTTLVKSL